MTHFISVAIPYVNAQPHLGYAFELVEADLAARALRALGEPVRFLGGTDDHSLKNVLAADQAGEPVRQYVDWHAHQFAELAGPLGVTFDDFLRTSADPRHRPAVERLWRACDAAGDLYVDEYEGLYCVGCEQFFDPDDLVDGVCVEHGVEPERVVESNWFFRLSRYSDRLAELIESGELQVEPEGFRREALAAARAGLHDISVSRPAERSRGWGIEVPGDASQVVYVWFDALTNYISALGYGAEDSDGGDDFDRWWRTSTTRTHVIGKGILRFHALYWPAFLLSAGEPLPTRIHVHPYLTVDGWKLSKSAEGGASPTELTLQFGADALRWWFASEVAVSSDTDFSVARLVERANDDLANGVGNTVNRVVGLGVKAERRGIEVGHGVPLEPFVALPRRVASLLAKFDRRGAAALIVEAVAALNQHIAASEPWKLTDSPSDRSTLARLLASYVSSLRLLADSLEPIAPGLSVRVHELLDDPERGDAAFARLEPPQSGEQ